MPVFDGKGRFGDLLMAGDEVMRYASAERLNAEFDDTYHTKHVDTIFPPRVGVDLRNRERFMAIDGTWSADMETPMGTQTISLQLASAGTTLTGKLSGSGGSVDLFDGHVDGSKASWKADITQPMPLTLEFSVTVDGAGMSGSVKLGMFGDAPLTGRRA
jgi:hypothetical protein